MGTKRHKPEEIVTKLRQVEVLCGQGMPRIDANDKAGKIILGVFVVVGLVLALVWIFNRVNKWADRAARQAQYVVLDAHLGRVPGAATPRRDGVEVD